MLIIAIDGFASCGKSTLAKKLAIYFDITHIDSGAMYRAITLFFQRRFIGHQDVQQIVNLLPEIKIRYARDQENLSIFLNEENVSKAIREQSVSAEVSCYATLKEVRAYATMLQRSYRQSEKGIVMDGRDIGVTVFPDATIKLFLQCDVKVRARRRYLELLQMNPSATISIQEVAKNIEQRDYTDTHRKISPLKKATDAIIIDNTFLDEKDFIPFAMDIVHKQLQSL